MFFSISLFIIPKCNAIFFRILVLLGDCKLPTVNFSLAHWSRILCPPVILSIITYQLPQSKIPRPLHHSPIFQHSLSWFTGHQNRRSCLFIWLPNKALPSFLFCAALAFLAAHYCPVFSFCPPRPALFKCPSTPSTPLLSAFPRLLCLGTRTLPFPLLGPVRPYLTARYCLPSLQVPHSWLFFGVKALSFPSWSVLSDPIYVSISPLLFFLCPVWPYLTFFLCPTLFFVRSVGLLLITYLSTPCPLPSAFVRLIRKDEKSKRHWKCPTVCFFWTKL